MVARIQHNDGKLSKLQDDKDSENTKTSEARHLGFRAYLQDRNIENPATAEEFAAVLRRTIHAEVRTHFNEFFVFRTVEIF